MAKKEPVVRNRAVPDSTLLPPWSSMSPADRHAPPLVEAGKGTCPPGTLQGSFGAE